MDLTVKDAAKLLQTSERAIFKWIQDGTLRGYKINDTYRLNRVELLEWATSHNVKVSPEIFQETEGPPAYNLLAEAMRRGGVLHDIDGADKNAVIRAVCERQPLPPQASREDLYAFLLAREALGSTAIGNGIAIPHPRSPLILGVQEPIVTLAFLRQPIDFGALDDKPVKILFAIISTTVRIHLQLLSHLMFALRDPGLTQLLDDRSTAEPIIAAIERIEKAFADKSKPAGAGK